jgi:hypothetical protein
LWNPDTVLFIKKFCTKWKMSSQSSGNTWSAIVLSVINSFTTQQTFQMQYANHRNTYCTVNCILLTSNYALK